LRSQTVVGERPALVDRLKREYDEQINAMHEELARRRRAAFIPGDPRDSERR
jgi:hypothetical protein